MNAPVAFLVALLIVPAHVAVLGVEADTELALLARCLCPIEEVFYRVSLSGLVVEGPVGVEELGG